MNIQEKAKLFMARFRGREDVYAKKWYNSAGKPNYAFVCNKFFSEKCHIKLNDGITCSKCEIRDHEPVSEASVIKHITGLEEQAFYVVRQDGLVYFGTFDFDCKPGGKADSTYYWEDVKKTCDVLDQLGIKYGIARSTTDGFHVYMFFETPYSAYKFAQIAMKLIFKMTGFEAERANGIRKFPEFFPKQANIGTDGFGNCIKPPMIETRWVVERNCFVNSNNEMIHVDQQWNHFRDIPNNTPEHLDSIIVLYGIEIEGIKSTTESSKVILDGGGVYDRTNQTWQKPHSGSMEKLIEGCAAFRRLREKFDRGEKPSHDEGFALFHTGAMATRDGIDYFKAGKVPEWFKTAADERQLMQSINKGYKPWTCKTMQAKGICTPGTKCFEKRAPVKIRDGREFIDTQAPIEEWPDPSPIRYARGGGEDFLKKLIAEVSVVTKIESAEQKSDSLKKIAFRAQVFDKDQQGVLKKVIAETGMLKARELNSMFNKAENDAIEETERIMGDNTDFLKSGGLLYKKKKPYGYQVARKIKNNDADFFDICDFDLWILQIQIPDEKGEAIHQCKIEYADTMKIFEISESEFFDDRKLYQKIGSVIHDGNTLRREEITDARIAWQIFSKRKGIKQVALRSRYGWNRELTVYVNKNIYINQSGIHTENEEHAPPPIDDEFASQLDFSLVSEETLKLTLVQIKNEFLPAYPAGSVQIGIAHSVTAIIAAHLNFKQFPTLFYHGFIARGKTTLALLLMKLWGKYIKFPNWTDASTGGLTRNSSRHKDAVFFIDDYKPEFEKSTATIQETVQAAFDQSVNSKLNKDGTARDSVGHKAFLMATGEVVPGEIPSVISRMLTVEVPPPEDDGNTLYSLCEEASINYKSVLPHFIHWFLQQPLPELKKGFLNYIQLFRKRLIGKGVAQRVGTSLAQNLISWQLFGEFLLSKGVINQQEFQEYLTSHENFLIGVGIEVCSLCGEEQAGLVFKEALMGGVQLGSLIIKGIHDHHPLKGFIGEYNPEKDPDHVHLNIGMTMEQVLKGLSSRKVKPTKQAIGPQLREMGFIKDKSLTVRPSSSDGARKGEPNKYWVVPLEELFGSAEAIRLRTEKLNKLNQRGLRLEIGGPI